VEVDGEERLVILAEVERHYREGHGVQTHSGNGTAQSSKVKAVIQSIRRAVSQHHDLQVYDTVLLKVGGIPKTSSGKIQRHICRSRFLDQTLNRIED
jgi:acyl-CoA synthetase (AMP-forming)/AMP-acid ligase II